MRSSLEWKSARELACSTVADMCDTLGLLTDWCMDFSYTVAVSNLTPIFTSVFGGCVDDAPRNRTSPICGSI